MRAVMVGLWMSLVLFSQMGWADMWTCDEGGMTHVTNIAPEGKHSKGCRQIHQSRKSVVTVKETGPAGCRRSRADVIPASDRSKERYHRYDPYIAEAARAYSLPEALLRAVMATESDFDPFVVSCAGAKGLMQIMPDEEVENQIIDVFDPRRNVLGAARILRKRANQFHGDVVLTIAAYHAGPGAVKKYGGVPPYESTQKYVQWVMRRYERNQRRALLGKT